jgi:transcriptional regulator with XRE-family HTH domain
MDHFEPTPIHRHFSARVRKAMKKRGLTMRTAAPEIGISFVHLNRILCFHVDPSVSVMWKIATALSDKPALMFLPPPPCDNGAKR